MTKLASFILDFERCEQIKMKGDFDEKNLQFFLSKFPNLKRLSIESYSPFSAPSANFYDEICDLIGNLSSLEVLKLDNAEISAYRLGYIIENCTRLKHLRIQSSGIYHLKILAEHPKAHKIASLAYYEDMKSDTEDISLFQSVERESLLCTFIKNCGANLEGLYLGCHFLTKKTFETIKQFCPNFQNFGLLNIHGTHSKDQPFELSWLTEIAQACFNFPSKLNFYISDQTVFCSPHDAHIFMSNYFCRLKSLKLVTTTMSPLSLLGETTHLNADKIEKLVISTKKVFHKRILARLSEFHKLKNLNLNFTKYKLREFDKNEILTIVCSDSVEKLNIDRWHSFEKCHVICPNLKILEKDLSIFLESKRRIQKYTVQEVNSFFFLSPKNFHHPRKGRRLEARNQQCET